MRRFIRLNRKRVLFAVLAAAGLVVSLHLLKSEQSKPLHGATGMAAQVNEQAEFGNAFLLFCVALICAACLSAMTIKMIRRPKHQQKVHHSDRATGQDMDFDFPTPIGRRKTKRLPESLLERMELAGDIEPKPDWHIPEFKL